MLNKMKVAILHDYFDEMGGAEITLCYMARGLKATIFTTNIDRDTINKLGFGDVKIISVGRIPRIRHIKQLFAQLRFSFLKLEGFDLYIFGGCYSIYGSKHHGPNLWYCFSPQRGLYDLRHFRKGFLYFMKQATKEVQIYFDQKAVKGIEKIITPGRRVEERVRKYYKRDSDRVIHSPVKTDDFHYSDPAGGYWLSVQRIDPCKNIELQLDAFSKMSDEKLIIAGDPSSEFRRYFCRLREDAPGNVTFVGPVFNRKELADLYAASKGFITTSRIEGFGMTAIEAMASGKPVIAPDEDGYKETVLDGVTGKLIDGINPEKLIAAVKEIGQDPGKYRDNCLKRAKEFDAEVFIQRMKQVIKL